MAIATDSNIYFVVIYVFLVPASRYTDPYEVIMSKENTNI